MDPLEKKYQDISNPLSLHGKEILKGSILHELANAPTATGRSRRLPDGSYIDDQGNLISGAPQGTGTPPSLLADPNQYPEQTPQSGPPSLIADPNQYPEQTPRPSDPNNLLNPDGSIRPPDRTPPGYVPGTSPGQGVAPTPTGVMPPQPKPAPAPAPAPTDDAERQKYANLRGDYYRKRNQQEKDDAEERLAVIKTLDMSKMSASGRAQVARNKLRAERALKRDKFSDEDINRMADSDTKERFLSPEEKAAREARNKAAVDALAAEGQKRGGVTTIDRRGDNLIQGTSMTFNQFRERYGREYNALSNDDANLVRGAASNFASGRVSQSAQQAAQTADAMNRQYADINQDLRRREGEADRAVDQSRIELDRFRNDPNYRDQVRARDIANIQSQPGFVQGVAQDMATGVSAETARRAAEAERQAFERRAAQPGRVGTPSLLARPEQAPTPNTPQLLSRPGGSPPEAPSLLQAPFAQPPARPSYTGPGSIDYGKAPNLLQAPENQIPPYRGIGSRTYSPVPAAQTVNATGGQVTAKAGTMSVTNTTGPVASPSGTVSPTAPIGSQAPRQPLGSTITAPVRGRAAPQPTATPARGQPALNPDGTEKMNQPMELPPEQDEQQMGGPSEANRAIPSPSQNAFAAAQQQKTRARGGAVTRAARTFRANSRIA